MPQIKIPCNVPNCNCQIGNVEQNNGEVYLRFKARHRGIYHESKIDMEKLVKSILSREKLQKILDSY